MDPLGDRARDDPLPSHVPVHAPEPPVRRRPLRPGRHGIADGPVRRHHEAAAPVLPGRRIHQGRPAEPSDASASAPG